MEISTGTSTRRPELLSSHDDRLVLAAAVQNKLEEGRSLRSAWCCSIDTHGWQHCGFEGEYCKADTDKESLWQQIKEHVCMEHVYNLCNQGRVA